jgi:TolB-like protein
MAAVALVLTTVGLAVWKLGPRLWSGSIPGVESIAVQPLENLSGDPAQEYFADGMTEALIGDLTRIRALRIVSRTSVMPYKRARKPLPEIARELKVDAVLAGSVIRSQEQVRITLQLIHAASDRNLWSESYEGDVRRVLGLQREVASASVYSTR